MEYKLIASDLDETLLMMTMLYQKVIFIGFKKQ